MSKVLILHTGGTLGMRPRHPDEALAPDEFGAAIHDHAPELDSIAEIETRMLFNIDSADMTPAQWQQIGEAVFAAYQNYSGIVVTHGTDTMVYTASALSYLLRNLPLPVIMTGSQRPLADVHTDGRANLVGAVDLALRPIPEVGVYFDGELLRGNRAVKYSTFDFDAFRSPHFPPLAEIGTEVRLLEPALQPRADFALTGGFDARVVTIRLQPGDDGEVLRSLLKTSVRAVLLIAFGYGNISTTDPAVAEAIRSLVDDGRVVAVASQSFDGTVDMTRYAGGRLALECGAVGIGDMTVPAATTKLMYLLGTHDSREAVRERLNEPIAGEVTPT